MRKRALILLCVPIFLLAGCGAQGEPAEYFPARPSAEETAGAPLQVEQGLDLSLWASLPGSPVALSFDGTGRAYVTQTVRRHLADREVRAHMNWLAEDLALTSLEEKRALLHAKLAPSLSAMNTEIPDFNQDGLHDWRDLAVPRDRVLRVIDVNGDGQADSLNVYAEVPSSELTGVAGGVLFHQDQVFLAMAPDLWRLSGAERADRHESISHGYGVHLGVSGHGMSGVTLGPDGRIYWKVGDIGMDVVTRDGVHHSLPHEGAVVRSNPDGSDFEVFARGIRNLHEMAFDAHGNLISVDNNANVGDQDRLVYIVDGSDGGWRNRFQWDRGYTASRQQEGGSHDIGDYNIWTRERLWAPHFDGQAAYITPPVASFGIGPAGFAYNPGTALDESWQDFFFLAEFTGMPAGSGITAFRLEELGASFRLAEERRVARGFLATSLDFGPDGALYAADWVAGWRVLDKGRIWKLDAHSASRSPVRTETRSLLAEDFAGRSTGSLAGLLRHADMRVRMKAQFELVERGEEGSEQLLLSALQPDHSLARLHGIWGLGQLGRNQAMAVSPLLPLLEEEDPEVRAQAARVIGEAGYVPAFEGLSTLVSDPAPRVRFFAAQALGRLGNRRAVPYLVRMLEQDAGTDPFIRQAGALALARVGDAGALIDLVDHASPDVRIAAVVALRHLGLADVALFLNDPDDLVLVEAARAIHDDESILPALPDLAALLEREDQLPEAIVRRAINANLRVGGPREARRLASYAARINTPNATRVEALHALGVWENPPVLDRLEGIFRRHGRRDSGPAREALASFIDDVLVGASDSVRVAAAGATGRLMMLEAAPRLSSLLADRHQPDQVRRAALKALGDMQHERFPDALRLALRDPSPHLRIEAQRLVTTLEMPGDQAAALLEIALESGTVAEQQAAFATLGRLETAHANAVLHAWIDRLEERNVAPEIELDILLAAEESQTASLRSRVERYRKRRGGSDPLAHFDETLVGGDREEGRKIFFGHPAAECARCHTVDGSGGQAGPDLSTVGNRLERPALRRALIGPRDAASAMPPMGSILSAPEVRHLVEYLSALR